MNAQALIGADERRLAQLRQLTEVSRALTYAASLDDVVRLTVERAAELVGAGRALLMLTNDEGLLSIRAAHGVDPDIAHRFREPLDETLTRRLAEVFGEQASRFLGVPLVVGGHVTGILAVTLPDAEPATDEQEWLLSALADQAAVALEKSRLDENAIFRERLIGIVSHDLRNPVSAILLAVDVIRMNPALDPRTRRMADTINDAAHRASRLIYDLLDYTQSRLSGALRINPAAADLDRIVRLAVTELRLAHPERGIDIASPGPTPGHWDADRLTQVVANLVGNALAYSPADARVRVAVVDEGSRVTLSVHNDGSMIPPERLASVFEPMQRATQDLGTQRSVGLGLYIVRSIVQAHGGDIAVTSTLGEGTTFVIGLPKKAPR